MDIKEFLLLNGFIWIYDEDGPFLSYLKHFSDPDEDGKFEYELINYFKDKGDDWYTCELHCRRNLNVPPEKITLINPSIDKIMKSMELLGFEKILEI